MPGPRSKVRELEANSFIKSVKCASSRPCPRLIVSSAVQCKPSSSKNRADPRRQKINVKRGIKQCQSEMEVYQRGGNNRQQDRSTRRRARLVPRLLGTSTRLHQQVSGAAAVMVKFKWPSLPPGLPSRLGIVLGKRTMAPIVSLSGCLSCISPILFRRNQYSVADRRRDGRRGALTADDSTRANLEQVVTVIVAQYASVLHCKTNSMIRFDLFKVHSSY